MKTYARIANGQVVEVITTAETIGRLFHPSLHWEEVTGTQVQPGWVQGAGGTLTPPPAAATATATAAPPPAPPSVSQLLDELTTLRAQVAQLHTG